MTTILIPPAEPAESVLLDQDEVHHLRVRRVELPTDVRYLDGAGTFGTGRLEQDGRDVRLVFLTRTQMPRPGPRVLAVGAGDKDRFAWMVEKATELGVTDIVLLELERGRDVATRIRENGRERLERRARESLKQCGRAWAPVIHPPGSLSQFLAWAEGRFSTRWLLDADGSPAGTVSPAGPVSAIIGPEGGLTAEERAQVIAVGFEPVRIGSGVLRFETAAIAAAVLMTLDQNGAEATP